MIQTKLRPTPAVGSGAGLGDVYCSAAIDSPEFSASHLDFQAPRAVLVLARRFRLPISTAATVAALAGYGEARHG